MTPRINENVPRNEITVMIAIKDPASCGDDAASLCTEGDDVGDDDACCELEFDCASGVDEVDVVVGDGSGVTGVTDTATVDVGRPAGVAGLAALCEVVVTDEAAGTTGDGEGVTTGGRWEVITGGIGGGKEVITGGTGGMREVTMGRGKVTIGVSDDAGGVAGEGTDIGKDEGQSLTTVVTDGGTPGAKDRVVTEDVSCEAESIDEDGLPSTGEDRGYSVSAVVTDGGTAGGKDEAVTDDAGGVTGDVPMGIGDDAGPPLPPTEDPPASN